MNELGEITGQIAALLKARDYLLRQQPSDPVALAQIAEDLADLNSRQVSLNPATLQAITPEAEEELKGAIRALDRAIEAGANADAILAAVTDVLGAAQPK